MNIEAGQGMLDGRAQPVEIAGDCDVKAGDLTSLDVEEIDTGLADRGAMI